MKTYIYFHHQEIFFPLQPLIDCSHQGTCGEDCEFWEKEINWNAIPLSQEEIIQGLLEYGAWKVDELDENPVLTRQRFLWIIAGDWQDSIGEQYLAIESCRDGILEIIPFDDDEPLDLEKMLIEKWGQWVGGNSHYAAIYTDGRMPDSGVVWESMEFGGIAG